MRYQAPWFVLAALCLPPSPAIAQHSGDSVREVFYPTVAMSNSFTQPMVVVDRGFLIAIRNRNYLIVHDRDGKSIHDIELKLPGTETVSISDVAMKRDGTAVLALIHTPAERGYGGAIAILEPAGKIRRLIQTGLYMPLQICLDEEDRIWTAGWQRDADRILEEDKADYPLIRKYGLDGTLILGAVKRTSVDKGFVSGGHGRWKMRAAHGLIGILSFRIDDKPEVWTELNLKGEIVGQWTLGPVPLGRKIDGAEFDDHYSRFKYSLGFTVNGELYALCWSCSTDDKHFRLARLDRKSGDWKIMRETPRDNGILIGSDGNELVLARGFGGVQLTWIKPTMN